MPLFAAAAGKAVDGGGATKLTRAAFTLAFGFATALAFISRLRLVSNIWSMSLCSAAMSSLASLLRSSAIFPNVS